MKGVKFLLFAAMLVSLTFAADWQVYSVLAILASVAVLALLYALATGFSIQELQLTVHEEFYQLLVTVVLLGSLVGIQAWSSDISTKFFDTASIQESAKAVITFDTLLVSQFYDSHMTPAITYLGQQGAKSSFCSFQGVGASISTCGGFRALAGAYTVPMQAVSVVLAELQSISIFLGFSDFAFTLFIPLGLFLRTFKISRGAGGFLIALGVAFYFVLPFMITITDRWFVDGYIAAHPYLDFKNPPPPTIGSGVGADCDEFDAGSSGQANLDTVMGDYEFVKMDLNVNLAGILIYGIFMPAVYIMATVASIRALTALGGAEIDISAIARIA